ncbi:unnamed protein product, partial [Ixodes pacificus]
MIAVYYSVLNAPTALKSRLSQIHLALLVNEKLALKHGLDKVFEPLIEDILYLESTGIVVHGETLNGSVLFLTGDNLSCHRIGGFKCSFSHGRICRYCLALRHEISVKHSATDFIRRTPEGHMYHLRMKNNGVSTLSLYGVKEACPLTFTGFQPTEHLPPDVMHDIHEGVLPFVLRHVLCSLITSGMVSLSDLNAAVIEHSYAPCDRKNKPEIISMDYIRGKANVKGNASQIFCFFRHLALYVGGCVPCGHDVWKLYLSLREIVDAVMSKRLPLDYVCTLRQKIESFCREFQTLFPATAVPCKMHYLVHYPDYILKYGPLVNIWAMRYEAKHQYFKNITRKIRNFKNITGSLSRRHQLL